MTFYAVAEGRHPGIYQEWLQTEEQIKGYPGAIHKKFSTMEEAEQYMKEYTTSLNMNTLNTLTEEQRCVLDHLLRGDNVFLTGGGGVGKSYLLSVIYTEFPGLKRQLSNASTPRIQICALTGCAALLLGHKAKTIHSWAGIGLGKGTVSELYVKIRKNRKAMQKWLTTDLLIIDEVSMMTDDILNKLNDLGKKIRGSKKPFGGIQLLLVGDFFQLPPVNKSEEATVFAFESDAWKEAITCSIELTQIQRQKDVVFQDILKEARMGALTKESCAILRKREGLDWKNNKIKPTLLFPRRSEVEMINDSNLRALTGRKYTYKTHIVYDGKQPKGFTEEDEHFKQVLNHFDANAPYSRDLELIQGSQVMLIANVDPNVGLVNGSRGIVTGFCPSTELPMVEFINGVRKPIGTHAWPIEDYEFASRTQIPLRLAWACTTHKAQGASLDSALVDIGSGNFEFGQAYVALSRARSLDALYVYDFDPVAFKAHPKVKTFYASLVMAKMSEEERSRFRLLQPEDSDVKAIIAEPLKPVRGVTVVKEVEDNQDPLVNVVLEPGAPVDNWLYESVPEGWKSVLEPCKTKLLELSTTLSSKSFLPKKEDIWSALELTPLNTIKVVILGQDPYPTPGNAHGLAFSVLPNVKPLPASLRNIYKERLADLQLEMPSNGSLVGWAQQGILLLNTVLTVEAGDPQSHSKMGWEEVTDQIIRAIAAQQKKVVFVLWGKSAQVKKKLLGMYLEMNQHKVFESAHPSPLSATKGFFGSKPFSTVNGLLKEMGQEMIQW